METAVKMKIISIKDRKYRSTPKRKSIKKPSVGNRMAKNKSKKKSVWDFLWIEYEAEE